MALFKMPTWISLERFRQADLISGHVKNEYGSFTFWRKPVLDLTEIVYLYIK